MPRYQIDYSKGQIYKIVCRDLTVKEIYVGSTTDLGRRRSTHKGHANSGRDLMLYNFIRQHGGWDNWQLLLIELFPCSSSEQLRARERYFVDLLGATLNMVRPLRTRDEYREDHRLRSSEYHQSHREIIAQRRAISYQQTKDHFAEKRRENREVRHLWDAEVHLCSCGRNFTNSNKARHQKTAIHIQYLLSINPDPQPSQLESTHSDAIEPDSPPSNLS